MITSITSILNYMKISFSLWIDIPAIYKLATLQTYRFKFTLCIQILAGQGEGYIATHQVCRHTGIHMHLEQQTYMQMHTVIQTEKINMYINAEGNIQ